jgi:hypothetical protein
MRILLAEQFSELGGGQRDLLDLLPGMIAKGWQATVAAPGSGPLFERVRQMGAKTVRIGIGEYAAGHKTVGDAARFLLDTIALGRWIARQDFDLISVGGARLMPAVARGAKGRPVVFQALHFLGKSYAVALAVRAIRSANAAVIANSGYVASQFPPPVRVIYQGVPEIPFAWPERRDALRIGIVGRIAPMKGHTDFLRAAARIARELPAARFVICGAPMFTTRSYVDEVHQLARGLPVEFLGWREDVGAVLADLDLLVVPSTAAEATTRVIVEAFSAGVPVVAYTIGGISEIVRDGENGFLVPECEPAALARKLLDVARMDLRGIASRARADWEQRYTVDRYRREMTDAMEGIMNARETTSGRLRPASG